MPGVLPEQGERVGSGVPSWRFEPTEGTIRWFRDPGDVIAAFAGDLEDTIALVSSGGTTFLSPILGRLGGIVALDGTLRSHLAIVSREFDVPCLVGAELWRDLVDGDRVRLQIVAHDDAHITVIEGGAR